MKFQSPFDTENILTPDATIRPEDIEKVADLVESAGLWGTTIPDMLGLRGEASC